MLIALIILLLSPFVARAVGRAVERRLGVTPGAAGARMPRLPDEEGLGRGQHKLLKWLAKHPSGVEAAAAAAAVHLTPERVEAWLEGLALRLPCRVRITRRGRATYDFEPAALAAELRRTTLRGLGRPFAWVGLALVNLGASWPLIFSIGLVAGGLSMITSWEDEFIYFGIAILVGVGILAASVLGVSAILGWLIGPAASEVKEVAPVGGGKLSPRQEARQQARTERVLARARRTETPVLAEPEKKSRSWDLGNIDDPRALIVIVVAVLLLAVVGSALVGLYAWGVGLWRSLSGRRLHAEWMGPAAWAREQPKPDAWMRLVPTNDMVGRALRALRAALQRPRPADGHLADRVAALVRRGNGRLSALEVALEEGLDPDDAVEVLTRMCVRHDGRLAVSSAGDLVVFIPVFARSAAAVVPPFEALPGEGGGQVVSLPGLEAADRDAAARLAGGTLLLALGTIWLVAEGAAGIAVGIVAAAVSLAVTSLAAAVRHAIRAHAPLARLRDARRHAGPWLTKQRTLDLRTLVEQVAGDVGLAGPDERQAIRAELRAWLEALNLASTGPTIDLVPLLHRLEAARALPAPVDGVDDDEVIFDTARPERSFAASRRLAPIPE